MDLPNELHLSKISHRCLYCDKKSVEPGTGVIKKKYKLASVPGDIVTHQLNVYRFFIGTSQKEACQKDLTLVVMPEHWEHIDILYESVLANTTGYYDLRRVEVMSKDELLLKLKEKPISFQYAAKLRTEHFDQLRSLSPKLYRSHKALSKEKIDNILGALFQDNEDINKILSLLGLAN